MSEEMPTALNRGSGLLLPPMFTVSTARYANSTGLPPSNLTSGASPPLNNTELITLVVIGLLGITGTILNSGVLFIVYKGRLVKKDYRMLYYIFITVGDLLFAIHTVLNSLSILYRDWYVFKYFAVCLNIHVTLGVTSYQWSAMCIVLLIIDLIMSLKHPFADDKPKRRFSKIACITAFILGVFLSLVPFAVIKGIPSELPFCSIANVYGSRWSMYQIEAVSVLSVLFSLMLGASMLLLYTIYRSQAPKQISDSKLNDTVSKWMDENNLPQGPCPRIFDKRGDLQPEEYSERPSPHPKKKHSVTSPRDIEHIRTISSKVMVDENVQVGQNCIHQHGIDNDVFVHDEAVEVTIEKRPEYVPSKRVSSEDDKQHCSKRDVQRKQFFSACRNVAAFMTTYLGSCLPYYVYLIATLDCAPDCYQDTPQQRVIRVVVATFLYILPIIDPILYTQRFSLFKKAALEVLRPCLKCIRGSDTDTM